MSDERTVPECEDCGGTVPLFAPECPACGAGGPGSFTAACGDCGVAVGGRESGGCPECDAARSPWDAVVERVRAAGFHVDVPASRALPHPVAAGFERGRGKPAGQRADYRRPLPDGTEIHVREYDDRYLVHRDRRSANHRVRHLVRDAPLETAAGATALTLLLWGVRRAPVRPTERPGGSPLRSVSLPSVRPGWVSPLGLAARAADGVSRPSPSSLLGPFRRSLSEFQVPGADRLRSLGRPR